MTFGLLGYPLTHSFSRPYFTKKFQALGLSQTHQYLNFELADLQELPATLAKHADLRGFNITLPHKQGIIPFLDELAPGAAAIGAVNTVLVEEGKMIGYNTDLIGFKNDLLDFIDAAPQNVGSKQQTALKKRQAPEQIQRALVLGTGGAAAAVHYALETLGIESVAVSRRAGAGHYSYAEIKPELLQRFQLVVNTTPLGTYPNITSCPDLPYTAFNTQHYCYDLVYNPAKTTFLQHTEASGAKTRNGLGMLHGQAEAAWEIWNS